MQESHVKLGSIGRESELALGVAFTSDVGIYVEAQTLNRMAVAHPKGYLALLERAKRTISSPDFVRFLCDGVIEFCAIVYSNEEFIPYVAVIEKEGTPAFWFLRRLYRFDVGGKDKKGPAFIRVKSKGKRTSAKKCSSPGKDARGACRSK